MMKSIFQNIINALTGITSGKSEGNFQTNKLTQAKELWIESQYESDPAIKEKMLLQAEENAISSQNYSDLHFIYNFLIEHYYQQRDTDEHALDTCIKYCKKDIKIFSLFKNAYINENLDQLRRVQNLYEKNSVEYKNYESLIVDFKPSIPNIPSFKRLAIILEKQGKYDEAIKVCNMAITYNLTDGTKGGFKGRKERIYRKSRSKVDSESPR